MASGDLDLDTLYCRFIDSIVNHRRLDHLDQFLPARLRSLLTGSVPDATGTLGLPVAQCRPCNSV